MNQVVIQKIDRKTINKAQLMYFGNRELTEIAAALSIEPDTLRFYIFGVDGEGEEKDCWYQIKKNLKPTAIALYLRDKVHILEQTAGLALDILNFSLSNLRDRVQSGEEEPLSIDDMTKLSKIVTDMDKVYRLESGMATETIEHMGLSRAQAREILANDPFTNDVEVESIELPWLNDEVEVVEK